MHGLERHAGPLLGQKAGEMRERAGAGRAHRHLAALLAGLLKEFRHRPCRHRRIDHQDQRLERNGGDEGEVLLPVVRRAAEQGRAVGQRGRRHEERVAVGRRTRDKLGADHGAGAGLVLDDDRLTQFDLQPRRDDAGGDVDISAGCEGRDDLHRFGRPVLRVGRKGQERETAKHAQEQRGTHDQTFRQGLRRRSRSISSASRLPCGVAGSSNRSCGVSRASRLISISARICWRRVRLYSDDR